MMPPPPNPSILSVPPCQVHDVIVILDHLVCVLLPINREMAAARAHQLTQSGRCERLDVQACGGGPKYMTHTPVTLKMSKNAGPPVNHAARIARSCNTVERFRRNAGHAGRRSKGARRR